MQWTRPRVGSTVVLCTASIDPKVPAWMEGDGKGWITADCDVLEADGGTRTASITGGFVALAVALATLKDEGKLTEPVIRELVAATSVEFIPGEAAFTLVLDLVYLEDSLRRGRPQHGRYAVRTSDRGTWHRRGCSSAAEGDRPDAR